MNSISFFCGLVLGVAGGFILAICLVGAAIIYFREDTGHDYEETYND